MTQSGQSAVDRRGALPLATLHVLEVVGGQCPSPLVRMIDTGSFEEKSQELAEVAFLSIECVVGSGCSFQSQIQVEPLDQTVASVSRNEVLRMDSPERQSGVRHARMMPENLPSCKQFNFRRRDRPILCDPGRVCITEGTLCHAKQVVAGLDRRFESDLPSVDNRRFDGPHFGKLGFSSVVSGERSSTMSGSAC